MRKLFLTMTVAALFVTAAKSQDHENHDKDNRPQIEGSGNIVTKEFNVTPFTELDVKGVFNVLLTQGNKEGVKIEADDNLQSLFEVKNVGSRLVISMKENSNFNSKKKLKVYISFKNLKNMELKTVGDISSENDLTFDNLNISSKSVGSIDLKMTAQSINVDNKSVGSVKLNGKAENAIIRNKGVGSVQAASFLVQKMDIENSGVGSAEVNAAKEIIVKDSFLGKVTNKGAAPMKKLKRAAI